MFGARSPSGLSGVHVEAIYGLKGSGNDLNVFDLEIRPCVSAQVLWHSGYNTCFGLKLPAFHQIFHVKGRTLAKGSDFPESSGCCVFAEVELWMNPFLGSLMRSKKRL